MAAFAAQSGLPVLGDVALPRINFVIEDAL
jgi:hypothetical protein